MTPVEKAAIAISLPTLTAVSPEFGISMAFGLIGGWLARAGISVRDRKPWDEIIRDQLVSLLISVGSILLTMWIAQMADADELGVAAIGFAVTFAGTDALEMFKKFVLTPIGAAIRRGDGDSEK